MPRKLRLPSYLDNEGGLRGRLSNYEMLNGKTAIVTGSTSGIGLGTARSLAEAGCNVVLNGFGEAKAIESETRAN
jgi:S-adenosylhomocysteine hydrolase